MPRGGHDVRSKCQRRCGLKWRREVMASAIPPQALLREDKRNHLPCAACYPDITGVRELKMPAHQG